MVARRVIGVLVVLALAIAAVVAFMHRQEISDFMRARGYDASSEIIEISDHLRLTSTGKRVFLATRPTLDGSQKFNERCQAVEHTEDGHVLGCYSEDAIHLFDVTDERISGVVEVTAAHELLHAVWTRLGAGEREELSDRLRAAYEDLAEERPELTERMSVYEHLSDAEFANELHSVLGTEVRELPEWLEDHYAQWFIDRSLVVDDFDGYHSVFTELQDRADALNEELSAIRDEVEQRNSDYEAAVEQYNADARSFRERNEAYEFADDPDEFERIRSDLEARSAALDDERASIQGRIDKYEELRQELQSLSQTSDELDQHLNSDLAPPATRPG